LIDTLYISALILIVIRLAAFFTVIPVFFPKGTPNTVKVAFTIVLAYLLIPGIQYTNLSGINSLNLFAVNCINEVVTGLILGYITNLCFDSLRFAGNLMDLQMGFSMMSMLDPNTNTNTTLIERLLYWFGLILFLLIDGHHMLIRALIESFNTVNLGKFILFQDSIKVIIKAFITFFSIGLKIAIPIVLILIVTDLTMGLVARAVPQLNVMILGLPVKILVGMLTLSFSLIIIAKITESAFYQIPDIIKSFYKTIPFIIIFASDDKTEEATPHKMSEAKKKGQVAKSKDVSLALTLLASTLVLNILSKYSVKSLGEDIISFFNNFLNMNLSYGNLQNLLITVLYRMAIIILPMILPIMIMGILANFLQTGFILTKDTIKPDLSKLNPINGFKRMFSVRTAVELVKDIFLVTVIGYIGYSYVKSNFNDMLNMGNLTFSAMMDFIASIIKGAFFKITLIMMVIAIVDFIFQKLQFKKDMKMTKQEVKEEFKQEEGDPEIKGKIKQKQRELAMRRMMQQVPNATVVVTNPTHIAVALMYNEKDAEAPKVVAKGADYVAIKIKEKAKESNVPIIENKPLARLIYDEVELDSEIPVDMYQAVAEILAVVFKLNSRK
jgi:flagellar biosynthesis protein FliR/FlhB